MYIKSNEKDIPILQKYQVVVCGGGPSGFVAAIAAARMGASVALIERYGFLGGMATAGLVAPISEFMHEGELIAGGIPLEFVDQLEKMGYGKMCPPRGNFVYHPEAYKLVAQRMVLQENIDLYFHAYVSDCVVNNGKITHVIIESKSGTQAIEADYVIDATGDGDVAQLAKVPMQNYNMPLQPASMYFVLGNVDTDAIPGYYPCEKGSSLKHVHQYLNQLKETEKIPQFGGPWCFAGLGDGIAVVNMTRTAADWADERSATRAECELRESVFQCVALLRKHFKEFKNATLLQTSMQMGVRETRHIKGVHVLTGEEYRRAEHFYDSIARCSHPIDIHSTQGNSQQCTQLQKAAYLPYRSMIAEGFPNLLVPSRCFSADREAFASARVQVGVMGLGQGAGIAAALCAKAHCPVDQVDIEALKKTLTDWGACI